MTNPKQFHYVNLPLFLRLTLFFHYNIHNFIIYVLALLDLFFSDSLNGFKDLLLRYIVVQIVRLLTLITSEYLTHE